MEGNINLIKHPKNKGYGSTLLTGISEAKGDIIITMDSNKEVIANFKNILPIENYTLIIIVVGGGTTDPVPGVHEYRSWTFVNVTAIPSPGWTFDYWSSGGVNGSQNPLIVPMNKNRTVTAFFK